MYASYQVVDKLHLLTIIDALHHCLVLTNATASNAGTLCISRVLK